jgi:hypothetical protein
MKIQIVAQTKCQVISFVLKNYLHNKQTGAINPNISKMKRKKIRNMVEYARKNIHMFAV